MMQRVREEIRYYCLSIISICRSVDNVYAVQRIQHDEKITQRVSCDVYYDGTETTYSSIPFGTSPGRRRCGIRYRIRIQCYSKTDRYASRNLVSTLVSTLIVRGTSARPKNAMLDKGANGISNRKKVSVQSSSASTALSVVAVRPVVSAVIPAVVSACLPGQSHLLVR
jgi:hypothetical protein